MALFTRPKVIKHDTGYSPSQVLYLHKLNVTIAHVFFLASIIKMGSVLFVLLLSSNACSPLVIPHIRSFQYSSVLRLSDTGHGVDQ